MALAQEVTTELKLDYGQSNVHQTNTYDPTL